MGNNESAGLALGEIRGCGILRLEVGKNCAVTAESLIVHVVCGDFRAVGVSAGFHTKMNPTRVLTPLRSCHEVFRRLRKIEKISC